MAARQARQQTGAQEPSKEACPYTPVRLKVKRLESAMGNKLPAHTNSAKQKRGMVGQGRQPPPLQKLKPARATAYFGSKSSKAKQAQARAKERNQKKESGKSVMESQNTNIQGAIGSL